MTSQEKFEYIFNLQNDLIQTIEHSLPILKKNKVPNNEVLQLLLKGVAAFMCQFLSIISTDHNELKFFDAISDMIIDTLQKKEINDIRERKLND